jgi:two-component system heavy metal sensor histidine kinase CusS
MGLSIRWRLTLWNTVAVATVLLGLGGLVYALLWEALYEQVDKSLLTELRELTQEQLADFAQWSQEAKERDNITALVYDPAGKILAGTTEGLPVDKLLPPVALPPGRQEFSSATLPLVGHQRLLRARVQVGGTDYSVLLMAGLDGVDYELRELLTALIVALPVSLLAAGGLGYVLARKALAPVAQLHRLTQDMTADRLDRRLPVLNPGDEFGQLTQTINAMIGRLERSFAEIRRFTADASHELRTPLTAIRTETEVALRQPLTAAESKHLLGSILEECERLTHLTDQLLTLSREDAGASRPACTAVDLGSLIDGVVEIMRPLADAKSIQLVTQEFKPIHISGDDARLRQVFFNLLDNAIKYTPSGGRVDVRLAQTDHTAIVTMRDTGIGIAPEHLPRVFERFYRVDKSRSREEGGTGLGLSIAKTIVSAHGGRIELASEPGRGTTCTVSLPTDQAS